MTSTLKTIAVVVLATALPFAIVAPANADADRAQAQANFGQADINKDEQLDLGEFTTFIELNADHGIGRAGTVRRLGMHKRAFGQTDANRDGFVSKQEIDAQSKR